MWQKNEMILCFERINKMEMYFDTVCSAIESESVCREDPILREAVCKLTEYMVSGAWLEDYRLDEKGMIPPEIKRGVLSQDGLYNALDELSGFYN
ncbi:MAG: DUF4298 domain-containing protein [Oscillospiraceae bacterium]|nr:DUF4298 domain-containing protein [Oscillospiraceae bacterium]